MDVCFYHGNCVDGSLSAVCAKLAYPDVALVPLLNRSTLPERSLWQGRHVCMIDFSLPKDLIEEMHRGAASFVLLDHHETAFNSLKDLSYSVFDMNKSGAELSWDFFFPGCAPPLLIKCAGEADRGLNIMPETSAIMDYGYNLSFEPEEWLQYLMDLESKPEEILKEAKRISEWKNNVVGNFAQEKAFKTKLGGFEVWAINSAIFKNELADELCRHGKFAIVYSGHDGAWYWSLRSRNGFSVEKIALANGGGGHKGAAAFVAEYAPMKISSEKLPARLLG